MNSIAHHHERYDGSSYPQGLRGETISPIGQMYGRCNYYDTLLSDSIYCFALTHGEAVYKIKINRGKYFKPELVDLLLTYQKEFLKIVFKRGNAIYTKGTKTPVSMTFSGLYENFKGLIIDGTIVETTNYSVKSGSTIVTFKTDFLESLKIGEHKVVFLYADGDVEGTLTIRVASTGTVPTITTKQNTNVEAAKLNNIPKTGDMTNIILIVLIFIGSVGVLVILKRIKGRKDKGI